MGRMVSGDVKEKLQVKGGMGDGGFSMGEGSTG